MKQLNTRPQQASEIREGDGQGHYQPPKATHLGNLETIQNGYNGNNWDWSRWYYYEY
ncbi:MAG: hypothetical protein KDA84_09275 [Planctomycetaceae bacterium]|nr:hypothetical protein [Planctomycetaceae bacterium]